MTQERDAELPKAAPPKAVLLPLPPRREHSVESGFSICDNSAVLAAIAALPAEATEPEHIFRDSIQGVSDCSLLRLLCASGCEWYSPPVLTEIRSVLRVTVENFYRDTIYFSKPWRGVIDPGRMKMLMRIRDSQKTLTSNPARMERLQRQSLFQVQTCEEAAEKCVLVEAPRTTIALNTILQQVHPDSAMDTPALMALSLYITDLVRSLGQIAGTMVDAMTEDATLRLADSNEPIAFYCEGCNAPQYKAADAAVGCDGDTAKSLAAECLSEDGLRWTCSPCRKGVGEDWKLAVNFTEGCPHPYAYTSAKTGEVVHVAPHNTSLSEPRALRASDILKACCRLLPGELSKHAVSEATKAINKATNKAVVADDRPRGLSEWAEMRLDQSVEKDETHAHYIAMLRGAEEEEEEEEEECFEIEITDDDSSQRYAVRPYEQVLGAVMRLLAIEPAEPFTVCYGGDPVAAGLMFLDLGIEEGGRLSVARGTGLCAGLPQGYDAHSAGLVYSVVDAGTVLSRPGFEARPVSPLAAVAAAAVGEYMAAELLELAGNAARDNRVKFLSVRHVYLACMHDEELLKLWRRQNVVFGCPQVRHLPWVLNLHLNNIMPLLVRKPSP
jgi:hypothetical protein